MISNAFCVYLVYDHCLEMDEYFVIKIFTIVLCHLGNDPRIFPLYFTCMELYKCYMINRKKKKEEERFLDYGISWNMDLEDGLQLFEAKPFF